MVPRQQPPSFRVNYSRYILGGDVASLRTYVSGDYGISSSNSSSGGGGGGRRLKQDLRAEPESLKQRRIEVEKVDSKMIPITLEI